MKDNRANAIDETSTELLGFGVAPILVWREALQELVGQMENVNFHHGEEMSLEWKAYWRAQRLLDALKLLSPA